MSTVVERLLTSLSGHHARFYTAAIHDLYVAAVRGNRPKAADARQQLAEAMAATMGASEVLGAMEAIRAAKRVGAKFRDEPEQTILPRVTLTEALDDLVSRAPVTLQDAAERTAQRIAQLYQSEHVIAFARAAEQTVTEEAQRFIARALRTGIGEGEAGQALSMRVEEVRELSEPWSEAYARNVFRTNVNTAVTAGRFRMAREPEIKAVVPAFRFDAVGDSDTRPNHMAADGRIWSVDSPVWSKLAPPLGYQCRCQPSHVSVIDLDAMGRLRADGSVIDSPVPPDAHPDPGFRHVGGLL